MESFYVDPSALLKLYLREPESRAMVGWRSKHPGPLAVTHHGLVEIANGIALKKYRDQTNELAMQSALAAFDDDLDTGRYFRADLLWRAALQLASQLSRKYTAVLGCRSLDVIHVASALELGLTKFVTFDQRQSGLCRQVGLKVVTPAGSRFERW